MADSIITGISLHTGTVDCSGTTFILQCGSIIESAAN